MRKVLFMGLEDTGKTAIIEILKHKKIVDLKKILPTRGRRIEEFIFNNQHFCVWELAGPTRYRERWIAEKDLIFMLINELIFFINVQNFEDYEKSVKYLTKLTDLIVEFNDKIDSNFKIFIFLHKFDPTIADLHKYVENAKFLTDKIKQLSLPYNYEIWKTSVLNFQQNFFKAIINNKEIQYFGSIVKKIFCSLYGKRYE
jgi:GTPase SAR1 family protein